MDLSRHMTSGTSRRRSSAEGDGGGSQQARNTMQRLMHCMSAGGESV